MKMRKWNEKMGSTLFFYFPRELEKNRVDPIFNSFSGDSDFAYLTKKLRNLGKKVVVFSSKKTISWELKLEPIKVLYIDDLEDKFKR